MVTLFLFKRYAGTGREYNVTSAIDVEGVPPQMESISVLHGAFTGINVTKPDAPVIINNCTVQNNRGNFKFSIILINCIKYYFILKL